MAKKTRFADYEFRLGTLAVQWEFIGEGTQDEYDPDDENDEPLLRANLVVYRGSECVPVLDGSYCTLANTDTPKHLLDEASRLLIMKVRDTVELEEHAFEASFRRKMMEVWTWTEYDLKNDKIIPPTDMDYWR